MPNSKRNKKAQDCKCSESDAEENVQLSLSPLFHHRVFLNQSGIGETDSLLAKKLGVSLHFFIFAEKLNDL